MTSHINVLLTNQAITSWKSALQHFNYGREIRNFYLLLTLDKIG